MIDVNDLPAMFAEIRAVNVEKGWQPHDLEPGEVLGLLHSEVSEALDAYRNWGFTDKTRRPETYPDKTQALFKPEGVGSELADVLIRWVDNLDMFGLSPDTINCAVGRFGFSDRFGVPINVLHDLISRFSFAYDSYRSCPLPYEIEEFQRYYIRIFHYLNQMAANFGIDLEFEYRRKLAYNKTRPYRHGGKRV